MKVTPFYRLSGVALLGALSLSACGSDNTGGASGDTLNAEGSSAQANAIATWSAAFQTANSGTTVNYNASGSGAGVESFLGGRVPLAGSDSALAPEQLTAAESVCKGGQAIDLPMVIGPVALAYNLPGVDGLVLDAPTIAQIFDGKITSWDDAAIKALNPDATLPATDITAYHRSDESGTTDNFAKYLIAASDGNWNYEPGKAWPNSAGVGAAKSDGVTQGVSSTEGAITYVEKSFADNAKLSTVSIDTGASAPVALSNDAAAKTIETAKVTGTAPDLTLSIDYATKTDGAYPLVLVTYEITCTKGLAAADATLVKSFLQYTSSTEGQDAISSVGYAPLPETIRTQVAKAVDGLS